MRVGAYGSAANDDLVYAEVSPLFLPPRKICGGSVPLFAFFSKGAGDVPPFLFPLPCLRNSDGLRRSFASTLPPFFFFAMVGGARRRIFFQAGWALFFLGNTLFTLLAREEREGLCSATPPPLFPLIGPFHRPPGSSVPPARTVLSDAFTRNSLEKRGLFPLKMWSFFFSAALGPSLRGLPFFPLHGRFSYGET